jgi:prophage tail gpP-like protein
MLENPTFKIIANGFIYKDCWESIDIKQSMNNICNEITVSTLNFFEDKLGMFKTKGDWKLKKGVSYQAYVNDEIISTGYIDDVNIQYSKDGSSINFSMRDKTCDLVDCCYFSETKNEFKKQKLIDIITTICQLFSITVKVDPLVQKLVNTVIENYTIDNGRSAAELIVEECVKLGILVIVTGNGELFLTQPTLTNISSDILTETNILSCNMTSSLKDQFSNYITKAELPPDQLVNADAEQQWIDKEKKGSYKSNNIEDKELGNRFRPMILLSDTAQSIQDCVKRSVYEGNIRRAKSLSVNYEIEGWTEVNSKKVWTINKLVTVRDTNIEIDEQMLINSVTLNYSNDFGWKTTLELVRKECYSTNEQALQLIRKGF